MSQETVVDVLCALLSGAKGVRELQRAVGGSNKDIYASIDRCKKAGLVEDEYLSGLEYGEKQCGTRLIQLTGEGRELAESWVASGYLRTPYLCKVRERWIIAILHLFGEVRGSTRMMKLLFLLKKESGFSKKKLGAFYRFRPWKYGPFSKGVVDDIEELRNDGFITIEHRRFALNEFDEDEKILHVYKLTKDGKGVAKEVVENLPDRSLQRLEMLRSFTDMPLKRLLKYVYASYPRFIKRSTIVERVLEE